MTSPTYIPIAELSEEQLQRANEAVAARLEKVARAMCIASGEDPDKTVIDKHQHLVCAYCKAWENYTPEASRLIAGLLALEVPMQ